MFTQVKSTIQEVLNRHDITRPAASTEFEWLLVSIILESMTLLEDDMQIFSEKTCEVLSLILAKRKKTISFEYI